MTTETAFTFETGTFKTHNGTVTIENPATGQHRTFQVRTQTFGEGDKAEEKRVVALLEGPDNTSDYRPFAFVDETNGHVFVWRRFRGEPGEPSAWEKFAKLLTQPEHFQESRGLEYLFEGRCRRCGRALTTPESIKSGIGPICAGKE